MIFFFNTLTCATSGPCDLIKTGLLVLVTW